VPAAQHPEVRADDATGTAFGAELHLTDHGRPRTLADFRGKVVALFFGLTHCPGVCSTTPAELAQGVMMGLGPRANEVQGLFVTVGPERDTAAARHPAAARRREKKPRDIRGFFVRKASARITRLAGR
jgi:protein SCO1/2